MNQHYPASWYAASIKAPAEVTIASGEHKADVCVIGAGFTGLSTALTLAEQGRSVILVESRRVGWGASGRNGGLMIRGFVGQERFSRRHGQEISDSMTWYGNDLIRERVERYDMDCDLIDGYVELAISDAQARSLHDEYQRVSAEQPGRGWRLYDTHELSELYGTQRYQSGLLCESDGYLHPLKLCLGMADACRRLGVQIFEESPVADIQLSNHPIVKTEQSIIHAEHVVLATNIHHQLLPQQFSGSGLAIYSNIIATEPLTPELQDKINKPRHALCDMNTFCDYIRLSSDGRLLFGGRAKTHCGKLKSIQQHLRPRMLKVWPELADVDIDYAWGGKLGAPLNETPVVGCKQERLWYSFGYTGHGLNTANMMGKLMGMAICGQQEQFNYFADMPSTRIRLGNLGRACLLSLGVLYYRLMDS